MEFKADGRRQLILAAVALEGLISFSVDCDGYSSARGEKVASTCMLTSRHIPIVMPSVSAQLARACSSVVKLRKGILPQDGRYASRGTGGKD